ncbi:hypothetical protein [Chryseobacterium flavum]|uniref:hypothetical protein n=1 Tax=Chryseobacterium flavum TaxID=415851 RepID=UPI0028AB23D7|nr:hypothetical protein [Chryseobacterium flavum]
MHKKINNPKSQTLDSKIALENAVSVSGMLLTTECVITGVKSVEPAMPMGGGMPGMM